ncbi:ribose-phosphate pyrophosphokinase [Curtobacterium sp. MCBD17_040]|uniref:ribose-phosphate pyrophosphokinase n=1 Tax=Curtobacterium sp. MCBD17_040 TaxID=2175674 RepID=UPI000DA788C1|nr:ribose-phosphate pyrophosphokinase [Curtobacterium sp. MCBD17_040]WIB65389.1 ribose-phosphate pyrophosphokinase [Curtobacterium sp. MCBD17_040]
MTVTLTTRIGPGYTTTPTFTQHTFWAGEQHIIIANENTGKGPLTEVARIDGADGNDLITLAMWADAAHQRDARTALLIPYLPGARQDRGTPFGAKVYADLINAMHLDQVICMDPHSPVMPNLINNLTVIRSAAVIRKYVVGRPDRDIPQRYAGIIAPDKGAIARATTVAKSCGLPVYKAEKHRDPNTRELSGFTCEPLPDTGKFLVVDDICDGGGTFIGLAAATGLDKTRLGLYVTHGVFTDRAANLADHFAEIWTTNSYAPNPKPAGLNPTDPRADAFHTINIDAYLRNAITTPEPALAA